MCLILCVHFHRSFCASVCACVCLCVYVGGGCGECVCVRVWQTAGATAAGE